MFRKRRAQALTIAAQQHRARAEQLDREGEFFKANMERAHAQRFEKRLARVQRRTTETPHEGGARNA